MECKACGKPSWIGGLEPCPVCGALLCRQCRGVFLGTCRTCEGRPDVKGVIASYRAAVRRAREEAEDRLREIVTK